MTFVDQPLPLSPGVAAKISTDQKSDAVLLSIVDETGTAFSIQIPTAAASDLAVALVNAANGL